MSAALTRKAARLAVARARVPRCAADAKLEACIVLAGDRFVRSLNRRYRHRDRPTNVLSFAALESGVAPAERAPAAANADGAVPLGDVIVAFETAAKEAAAEGKRLAHHLSHLVVHGMLHLLGYDHQNAAAAKTMERLEARILSELGIADPYAKRRRRTIRR
ncbi:MAG: rRNA maturation RNase YbeY [Rhodospirillales bacterium]|nr:rRNA maturation RNase YbeY [Rhodospirillales bacterium]